MSNFREKIKQFFKVPEDFEPSFAKYARQQFEKNKQQSEKDLEELEFKEANKERERVNARRLEAKRKAQLDHDDYIHERDKKQEIKNEANTPRGIMRKTKDGARQNRERDDKMNLTPRQKRHKYMPTKDVVREINREAEEETDRILSRLNLSKFKTNIEDLT